MNHAAPAPDSPAGWRVLVACAVVAAFSAPALFGATYGLLMLPLQKELGWSRADIAFSLTLGSLLGPLVAPAIGWLVDNLRLRPFVLAGVVLQGLNILAYSQLGGSVWNFYALGIALMFTVAGASPPSLGKVVQGWFDKKLGTAFGILFACASAGGIIHPLWVQAVISGSGWRSAYLAMGSVCLLVAGAAAWWGVRERVPGARAPAPPRTGKRATPAMVGMLREKVWWKLAAWNMLFACGIGGLLVHFAPLLQDRGATPAQAAVAVSVMSAGFLLGNLAAGWLIDRVSARRLASLMMLLPLAAALILLGGTSLAVGMFAAVVFGLCTGSDGSLSAFLARRYFGGALYGQAVSTQQVAIALGGGTAPWISGLIRDSSGSYDLVLIAAAAAFGAAALVALWLPEPSAAGDGAQRHAVPPHPQPEHAS